MVGNPDDGREPQGVWHLMRPIMGRIRLAMALAASGALCGLGGVASLALAVNALLGQAPPWLWVGGAGALIVLAFLARALAFEVSHLAAFRLETLLRTRLSDHLARVPMGYLVTAGTGSLAKVMQDDVKNLHAFVADSTPFLGRSLAVPAATLALLVWLDWRLALAALAVLAVGVATLALSMRNRDTLQRRYDQENENVNSRVVEFVQAMPVVRTFDAGANSFSRYQAALERFRDVMTEWLAFASVSARLSLVFLGPLPTLFALSLAGVLLLGQGSLGFAPWVAALLIGTGLADSFMPLMWLQHFIHKANGSAKRIQAVLATPALPEAETIESPKDSSVRFEQVSFAYDGREENALADVSFYAAPGTVTALVGASGSGKSTVARLIPRFWDVQEGCVRVGGADVRALRPEVLMEQVAFVFQDNFLFQDTIANNIRLGRPDASPADIERAARAAQAHAFIEALPQGYDTLVGERGGRLSGGQRQRITIARAICRTGPFWCWTRRQRSPIRRARRP
ncbi:ABC transporter ATP-binding protein [Alkalilimnicola ehrlichii]|uniref:ABC transporter ATP-binding protein n=1 Tax=Alkalilimnicola ehrlichii TaxID=351052 RepID=UPI002162CADD|nr:ABC transporter ATP-binding protein [Alkalilimnicola ehrlichii]